MLRHIDKVFLNAFLLIFFSFSWAKAFIFPPEYCVTESCVEAAGRMLSNMDQTTDPCEDFYQYACGNWAKENPLPDDKAEWNNFVTLDQQNQRVIRSELENTTSETESEAENKARTYYFSCLDKNGTIEKLGAQPMLDLMKEIGGWNISGDFDIEKWDFQDTMQFIHNYFGQGGSLFKWNVGTDEKNASTYVLKIGQSGLGLPSKDYYLNKSDDDRVLREYLSFMTKVGVLLGGEENSTRAQMEQVLELEKKLAAIMSSETDPEKTYNKKSIQYLQDIAPFLKWLQFLNFGFEQVGLAIDSEQDIVISSPEYMKQLSDIVQEYLSTTDGKIIISNYLTWFFVQGYRMSLSKPFRDASKDLEKAVTGTTDNQSRWHVCVTATNSAMGFAVGAMFVRDTFSKNTKTVAEKMVRNIRKAFIKNLPNVDWMDSETREVAKEKAEAIIDKIGYPDFILNHKILDAAYADTDFDADKYFHNNYKLQRSGLLGQLGALESESSRDSWLTAPATVNAFYSATKNQMDFPAGILQPPSFFDPSWPSALHYGAMGVIMGHELTHGFDNNGRKYDKDGNLHQWWNNETIENFEKRAQCFVDQYSSYSINGQHINGAQTLGENIADNGGLKASFDAYSTWQWWHLPERPLPGLHLTNEQLFFLAFSQVFCAVATPEALHLQILEDEHAPNKYRIIGALSNSKEFARTYKCSSKSAMNPKKKCVLW